MMNDRPGPLSERVAYTLSRFPGWADSLRWLNRSVALSKGLTRSSLPQRVSATICTQLIGTLCLVRKEDVAGKLAADLIAYSGGEFNRFKADPRTLLQEALGKLFWKLGSSKLGPIMCHCLKRP